MLALLLSAAGLYASLAYQVALRTREIGIRSALGARRQSILLLVAAGGAWLPARRAAAISPLTALREG
ncbi:MAG: FtsX-like permease family protein [Bryobacterales bacterium]